MMVALDNLAAAAFAPASDVSVSKLPEIRSVGMALATGWRMASGAAGTFQTSRQSSLKYAQPPTPSQDGMRTDDKNAPQVAVALLGDRPKLLLTPG